MCGIAGIYFNDKSPISHYALEKLVNEMLLEIEHRGGDATGIACVSSRGDLHIEKADLGAGDFIKWRKPLPKNPRAVLCHTRFATKGTPMNLDNNHPIHYDNIVVTHNGHISNDDALFKSEDLGRQAEVDSEIIAALLNKYENDHSKALEKLDGNMAIAVSDLRNPNNLLLAKGWQSPLEYWLHKEGIIWASTKNTIMKSLRNSMDLEIKWSELESLGVGDTLFFQSGEISKGSFSAFVKTSHTYNKNKGNNNQRPMDTGDDDWEDSENGYLVKHYSDPTPTATPTWLENDDHPIAYSIFVGGKRLDYKVCDGCDTTYNANLLKKIGFLILCPTCWGQEKTSEVVDVDSEGNVYDPDEVHLVTCELLAEKHETTKEFINWLLFESEEQTANWHELDPRLIDIYATLSDDYDEIYKELIGESDSCLMPAADRLDQMKDAELEKKMDSCEFVGL